MTARSGIAGYLRERRTATGLTRAELAKRAGVSEALIQKIEQGTRTPTSTALGALFEALEVPVQFREHAATILQSELTKLGSEWGAPEPAELDFLNGLAHPACYQAMPEMDVIAANEAYVRAFPGLEPGTNIMVWMLTDPAARVAIGDWEREAHLQVRGFRHMAPGLVAPERIEEISRLCSASPDWDRLWSTDIPPADIPRRPMRVRDPDSGEWVAMHIQMFRFEVPRRPWWMYALVPIR
ncbi:helix-turn-helix domain-containing protein [Nocardia sp. 2]|uniref:Helix-turn-helix domain-containing protein n=1 Tax=Nocardia acididurans TaxID=2802282 RepID=A0ABS1MDA6_9NOCA|nr:helix-turn-helix domain-containing protein [Nocardia acididurans]MBL1078030.1 helix-turn-helix domain-containing protein [Nocardia acididurans]